MRLWGKRRDLPAISLPPGRIRGLLAGEGAPIHLHGRTFQRERRPLPPPEVLRAMGYQQEHDGWESPEEGPSPVLIALHATQRGRGEGGAGVPPGHLVATARLGAVVWEDGGFTWLISDVSALGAALRCPGQAGTWAVPAALARQVRADMGERGVGDPQEEPRPAVRRSRSPGRRRWSITPPPGMSSPSSS